MSNGCDILSLRLHCSKNRHYSLVGIIAQEVREQVLLLHLQMQVKHLPSMTNCLCTILNYLEIITFCIYLRFTQRPNIFGNWLGRYVFRICHVHVMLPVRLHVCSVVGLLLPALSPPLFVFLSV